MRIVIDIRSLLDKNYSGVSYSVYNLIRTLLKQDLKNEYLLFSNSFKKNFQNFFETQSNVKNKQWRYPNKILNYFFWNFLNFPKLDEILNIDIYWQPHINFIGLGERAQKKVITIHDLSFLRYPYFFSWRKNFWHKMMRLKNLVKKFDIIVAISENTKRDIIELLGVSEKKIKVIYHGANCFFNNNFDIKIEKFSSIIVKYKLPSKFILCTGTLEPRKNIEGLIEAYNYARQSGLDKKYSLVLVGGKGWKYKNIFKIWSNSPYKKDIIFTDYIENEDKPYIYRLASLFVFPSFYEGFGLPPLEAMASGIPVITSNVSSLPEIVGNAALMVNPYNIKEISFAMLEILNNDNIKNKLIARGLDCVKIFSWEKAAQKYLEIFNSL